MAELDNLSGARGVITDGKYAVLSPDGQWIASGPPIRSAMEARKKYFRAAGRRFGAGAISGEARPWAPEHWVSNQQFSFISAPRDHGRLRYLDLFTGGEWGDADFGHPEKRAVGQPFFSSTAIGWLTCRASRATGRSMCSLSPATGAKYHITKEGGRLPLWSGDARNIYYDWNGKMYSIPVHIGSGVTSGQPAPLPISGYIQNRIRRNYDLMPDGRQFVMLFRGDSQIEFLSNLFDDQPSRH